MRLAITTLLLAALVHPAWSDGPPELPSEPPVNRAPVDGENSPGGDESEESLLEIGPAERPSPAERRSMRAWHRAWSTRTRALRRAWRELVARLAGDRPLRVARQCAALRRSLAELDRGTLFPAPDGAVNLYLLRGLRELDRAALACRRDRFFELTYRLDAARGAFDQAARALARYELAP